MVFMFLAPSREKNLPRLAEDNWFTFFEASIRGNACESWCTAAKAQKVTPGGCWRSASARLIKRPVKKNGFDIHLISESTLRKCLLLPLGAVAVNLCEGDLPCPSWILVYEVAISHQFQTGVASRAEQSEIVPK